MATPQPPANYGAPATGAPYNYPPAPGGHPAPGGYPAPAPVGYGQQPVCCRVCGGQAAADLKVRAHMGILVVMKFEHLKGPFCRDCGIAVVRQMTTRTLCLGWWSPLSLVIFTPFTLVWNLFVHRKLGKLPASAPAPGLAHLDAGAPVLRRPVAYVALIPLAWAVWAISQIVAHAA
ncbi:hypothetical protein I3F58_19985 [Streptomyces sp. MUM 203J]|uniref:hypothetical protein n=1 Tax=Streptomyces sp. MUM 203J TaxID=2791990 RepID=UPI001F04B8C0|nr:hypothetical protein [Streptomyces sp. MUM 203J]MCH0541803.1 hypothetical protein [Streptomyces sp. MUM 203J]